MLVGITGGIGSGKTTVAKMFENYEGVVVYYADIEAKKLMHTSSEIISKLKQEFGDKAYTEDGELNRPYIAGIVFKDKTKLEKLNAIVHPVVYRHLEDFQKKHSDKVYILYENAILFENGSDAFCEKIITVTAPKVLRIARVVQRDKTTEEEVKNRMKNQWIETKKILQSHYVIHNEELSSLGAQVKKIHNNLTER